MTKMIAEWDSPVSISWKTYQIEQVFKHQITLTVAKDVR
jgi:hypothetical protein